MSKKIISIMLTLMLAAGLLAGCRSNKTQEQPSPPHGGVLENADGAVMLAEGGRSKYKIVIPEKSDSVLSVAANELQSFVRLATDCSLEIITDKGLTDDNSKYYLSIGPTVMLKGSGIDYSHASLKENGVSVTTKGNTVFLAGATSYGSLFSTYRFMYYEIGFEALSNDDIYYVKERNVPVYKFDYRHTPSIDERFVSFSSVNGAENALSAARRYLYASYRGGQTLEGALFGALWTHTIPGYLVSPDDHPEFYNNGQLCMTNEDAVAAVIEATKRYAEQAPAARFLQLGHADNQKRCECQTCLKEYADYGGGGGAYVRFLNKIAAAIEEWAPERDLSIIGLAYEAYLEAPVKFGSDGEITPIGPSVITRHNVGMMYAPIAAIYSQPLDDENSATNRVFARHLRGWAAVTDRLMVYDYGTNFHALQTYFNDWGSIKGNAEFYNELNVSYIAQQANSYNQNTPFESLKLYIKSNLWWDHTLDYNELVDSFMTKYYRAAAAEMKEYYEEVRLHAAWMQDQGYTNDGRVFGPTAANKQYWPAARIDRFLDILARAKKSVAESGYSDQIKLQLNDKILAEELNIMYFKLTHHKDYYSAEQFATERSVFLADCNRMGVSYTHYHGVPIAP